VNGFLLDARRLPINLQRQAYAKGLIPYIPSEKESTDDGLAEDEINQDSTEATEQNGIEAKNGQAFEFLFTLDMYDFEIWRKVTVPANITFNQLHFVIQSCFNWLSYHLYDFGVYDNSEEGILIAALTDNEEHREFLVDKATIYPFKTKLTAVLPEYKRIIYTYDYGDYWQVYCELANVIDNYTKEYPVCIEGEGDAPPDDVGGEGGFADFLEAIGDENHPEHKQMKAWGKSQRFEPFNIDKINAKLKKALSRTR